MVKNMMLCSANNNNICVICEQLCNKYHHKKHIDIPGDV